LAKAWVAEKGISKALVLLSHSELVAFALAQASSRILFPFYLRTRGRLWFFFSFTPLVIIKIRALSVQQLTQSLTKPVAQHVEQRETAKIWCVQLVQKLPRKGLFLSCRSNLVG
jgi:hypothetical protein